MKIPKFCIISLLLSIATVIILMFAVFEPNHPEIIFRIPDPVALQSAFYKLGIPSDEQSPKGILSRLSILLFSSQKKEVVLNKDEVNALLSSYLFDLQFNNRRVWGFIPCDIYFDNGWITAELFMDISETNQFMAGILGKRRFLNIEMTCRFQINDHLPEIQIKQLSIGGIDIPVHLANYAVSYIINAWASKNQDKTAIIYCLKFKDENIYCAFNPKRLVTFIIKNIRRKQ